MKKSDKKLIMFIGKTHSGKTTLATELEKINNDVIVLEADPIALFIHNQFPRLKKCESMKLDNSFKKITLRFQILLLFLKTVMMSEKEIILSNSNVYKKGRELMFKMCKKFNYKIIGVYFNYREETLFERIKNSKRTKVILRTSKNFNDLIINQRIRMEEPSPSDFDKFFMIKSEKDLQNTKNELIKILK